MWLSMQGELEWRLPPADLSLPEDEVHVWRAALDVAPGEVAQLVRTLSTDERQRAERLYAERDRQRYIVGRARLRGILARYLGGEPARLAFEYAPGGKPALAEASTHLLRGHGISFNLAHSHALALYAVSHGRAVGVDIEYVRAFPDASQIAERYFAPGERAQLRALAPDHQLAGFFACWTRKEAFIKATGEGLARPLDNFEVSLAPGEPAALLRVGGEPETAGRWTLVALTPAPGYAAALAVAGQGWRLACWQWAE